MQPNLYAPNDSIAIIFYYRTDREKSFLSSRVKSLQKQLDGGNVTTHPESKGSGDHRVDELETVITAMKKVIEKLKVENDHLKKSSAASSKLAQAKIDFEKRLAALQDENSKLKVSELELLVPAILCQFHNFYLTVIDV